MYRLLIISRKKATEDMFANMKPEELGDFKLPHFRKDYQGAMECLENHAIDAVAFDDEDEAFSQYLAENKPDIPIFLIGKNSEEQKKILTELDWLLIKLRADNANDNSLGSGRLEKERRRWINRILCGMELDREELIRHSILFRCSHSLFSPLWFLKFSIPKDDEFISERWHYGSDRLETALSNFFGKEYAGMRLYIAVLSPEEVRMICVPAKGKELLSKKRIQDYISETLDHIDQYLGLKLKLESLQLLPEMIEFANENEQ